jgi:hypothetical protein
MRYEAGRQNFAEAIFNDTKCDNRLGQSAGTGKRRRADPVNARDRPKDSGRAAKAPAVIPNKGKSAVGVSGTYGHASPIIAPLEYRARAVSYLPPVTFRRRSALHHLPAEPSQHPTTEITLQQDHQGALPPCSLQLGGVALSGVCWAPAWPDASRHRKVAQPYGAIKHFESIDEGARRLLQMGDGLPTRHGVERP